MEPTHRPLDMDNQMNLQPNRWTSRPFLLTLASLVTMAGGVAAIFGAPPDKANAIAALITAGLGVVAAFNGFELMKDKAEAQATIGAEVSKAQSESLTRRAVLDAGVRQAEAAATVEVAKVEAIAEKATAAATVDVATVEAGAG